MGDCFFGGREVEDFRAAVENCGVAVNDRGAGLCDLGMIEDAETNFGADSGGVAHCDRDEGRAHVGGGLTGDANGDEVSVGKDVFSQFKLEGLDFKFG